ncbi:GMC oxidoreductase-domain-containing protein [Pyronema domesticum]|nr:GMC oxidoreductase-domain-containing protein [Pyronema domesticum]
MTFSCEPDVIICGGGSAACIIAARLAKGTPRLNILVIEAGENSLLDPEVIRPGNFKPIQSTKRLKTYESIASPHLGGRAVPISQGHGLGGSSAVNFMMYTRASASDYNDWNQPGWTYEDLVPMMKKLETCHYTSGPNHGTWGPIAVSYGGHVEKTVQNDGAAAVQDMGYNYGGDMQDFHSCGGFMPYAKYIDPVTGHRQDTGHRYLHPLLCAGYPNLKVLFNTTVKRVVLENGVAVAVEVVPSSAEPFSDKPMPAATTISAKKLVIVSCGSLASPPLLERSGVGNPEILKAAGVETKIALPGVGENLNDHYLLGVVCEVDEKVETPEPLYVKDVECGKKAEALWPTGKGLWTTNTVDLAGKIRPTEKQLSKMGAPFKKLWDEYYAPRADKPVVISAIMTSLLCDASILPAGKNYFSGAYISCYPQSKGSVHITSPSCYAHPRLDANYASNPVDIPPLVWGYKVTREISRRMECVLGEVAICHPEFPAGSKAAPQPAIDRNNFDIKKIKDLEYTEEDDKAIEQWARNNLMTTWHVLGTCAMRPKEKGGVVDANLLVHGTRNLMVADMSIAPENVGSNTYNTAMIIGEKAATLAAEFLGVDLDSKLVGRL